MLIHPFYHPSLKCRWHNYCNGRHLVISSPSPVDLSWRVSDKFLKSSKFLTGADHML